MKLLLESMIFIISTLVLTKSSHTVVKSSVKIARVTGLGELTIGFLVLSVATSIPELIVSLSAILSGNVGIAIGNVLGSNITNVCLIIGLIGFLKPIRLREKTLTKLSKMLFLSTLVLVVLLTATSLSRMFGIILILVFLMFALYSTRQNITLGKIRLEEPRLFLSKILFFLSFYASILSLMAGLVVLTISSWFVIDSASNIASLLGIPESVIGATIIALSTSILELSTTLSALKQNHLRLGLGTTIGSCLTNLTLILGFILFLSPFRVDMSVFTILVAFALFSTILLYLFLGRLGRKKLERREGMILLIVYTLFILLTVFVSVSGLDLMSVTRTNPPLGG